jgi:hypothetical protein
MKIEVRYTSIDPVLCSNGHQPADARGAADLRKSGGNVT